MSCPLGETGVGKIGETPPNPSQELRMRAPAKRPRSVSGNRPRCIDMCRNCGYKLWPSSHAASAAFLAWRAADPARASASRFDLEIPQHIDNSVDFVARARELGIHLFPNSTWPFIICLGVLFL